MYVALPPEVSQPGMCTKLRRKAVRHRHLHHRRHLQQLQPSCMEEGTAEIAITMTGTNVMMWVHVIVPVAKELLTM
eukprot:13110337-Alexandrium_andersonii.AAC.1